MSGKNIFCPKFHTIFVCCIVANEKRKIVSIREGSLFFWIVLPAMRFVITGINIKNIQRKSK